MLDWTYGVEHELADWDRRDGLPPGWGIDRKDVTMVNSNGIAVDPTARLYPYGGEALSPPTQHPEGQAEALREFLRQHPRAQVNYRSNLHVHVRVPGLSGDLAALKRIQLFNCRNLPLVLNLIEPIPGPDGVGEEFRGACRRRKRRLVSHHTVVSQARMAAQLAASTTEEFFAAEVPRSAKGQPLWHLAPRAAVNLRHLREPTQTIEFRHWPGTLDPEQVLLCVRWCRDYLQRALEGGSSWTAISLYHNSYLGSRFPVFSPYMHWMECRYRATCHDGTLRPCDIAANIRRIESGGFDEHPRGLPWECLPQPSR